MNRYSLLVSSLLWLFSFLFLSTVNLVQQTQLAEPTPLLRTGLLLWAGGQVGWLFGLVRHVGGHTPG